MSKELTWQIFPLLAVRTTGFPIELLKRVQFPQTLEHLHLTTATEKHLANLQHHLLHVLFPQAVQRVHATGPQELLKHLSHWRRCVGNRRTLEGESAFTSLTAYAPLWKALEEWKRTLAVYHQQLTDGEHLWNKEMRVARRALYELMGNTTIQEALFLSNPSMYEALRHHLQAGYQERRERESRKIERRFMMYLQRFCTKNETQSFFGPVNYGHFTTAQTENILLQRSQGAWRERQTFASYWMVERLAEVISADEQMRPFLKPRRSSLCTQRDQQIILPSLKKLRLDGQTARLWQLADGTRTIQHLAALLDTSWEQVWSQCERWQRSGALVTTILVPSTEAAPLQYLQAWVAQLADDVPRKVHWLQVLTQSMRLLEDFAGADMTQRPALLATLEAYLEEICGSAMRRGAGTMYSDRFPFFEECLGNIVQCELGGLLAQRIEQGIQSLFHLSLAHGLLLAQRDQRRARALWQQLRRDTSDGVPFLTYLQALHKDTRVWDKKDALDDFLAQLHTLVSIRSEGHRACLHTSDLPALPSLSEHDACLYSSFDFLIASPSLQALQQGEFQLVLGEIHPYPLIWVFPTAYFLTGEDLRDVEALQQALAEQPGGAVAAQIAYTRKNKIFPYPLPGQQIELRPRNSHCRAIPASKLEVRDIHGQLCLATKDDYYRLYTPLTHKSGSLDPLAPFAFPSIHPPLIDLGEHTPRIEIDGVVYQRERWKLATGTFNPSGAQGVALLREAWRWREQFQLPMRMFVRPNKEPKPIYIDMSNQFFVEMLDTLARQNDSFLCTEILPDIHHLWLEQADGHYTCEFRAVVLGDVKKAFSLGITRG